MTTTCELLTEVADVERADLTPAQRLRRLVQAALTRTAGQDVGPIGEQLAQLVASDSTT